MPAASSFKILLAPDLTIAVVSVQLESHISVISSLLAFPSDPWHTLNPLTLTLSQGERGCICGSEFGTGFGCGFRLAFCGRPSPDTSARCWESFWENRKQQLPFAWRILKHGVCDGCSLGPYGLRDNVLKGTHLCMTRLKLLRLNTMDALPDGRWSDIAQLRWMTNEQLHRLGRLPYPILYRKGDRGFRRIRWNEAISKAPAAIKATDPERMGFFASSRGLTNEAYYTFQKLGRMAGTAHINSCARLCHAASTTGLKETIGWGAPTCALKDLIGTDLVILFATDLANNQPVTMKYLHYAKKAGTRVLMVNPFREPAMERYWVPSVVSSAIFGTQIVDEFFLVAPGGDIAFIYGVLKALHALNGFDRAFIAEHTVGFERLEAMLKPLGWDELEQKSGVGRAGMERFRTALRAGENRGHRLQHGAYPASLRRGQREVDSQPGARAREHRSGEDGHSSHSRPLRGAGDGRMRRGRRQVSRWNRDHP
jgi:hypothetical protein